MWSEPQRRREREERLIFLHFLHNFLSISSLKTLVCRMCRVCFPWTGYETCQNKKKNEKRRERESNTPPSLVCCVTEWWNYYTKNLLPCFFHFFIPEFPEHWATIITRILGPHTPVTRSDVGREENTNALFAKCIWLYFCPESCLIGVHVRKSMVDCGWGSATSSVRTPGFPSLHLLKHMSGL